MGKQLKIAAPEVKIQESVKVVFGFSELRQCSYIYATNDGKFFIRFIERLKKLCTLTWNQVYTSSRHSFGTETIMKENLNSSTQQLCPSGVDKLLILRATGDNHSFLGYRSDDVFQILFIEYRFGDIYQHY